VQIAHQLAEVLGAACWVLSGKSEHRAFVQIVRGIPSDSWLLAPGSWLLASGFWLLSADRAFVRFVHEKLKRRASPTG
jgi:hypothetical protein